MNSKILSQSLSKSCDSLNSESFRQEEKNFDPLFINLENIEVNTINFLNDEFINIGYHSIYQTSSTNYNLLFKNAIELIQRYNRQLILLNHSEDR